MVNPKEFKAEMQKLEEEFGGDSEILHAKADNLLCRTLKDLGYGEGVEIFEDMDLWYA